MKTSILSRLRMLLALSLALVLVLSLTGCFQKDDPDPTGGAEDPTTQVDPTSADPTEAPTEGPTEAPVQDPVQKSVMGTVTANNLNVRSNPSTDSTVLSQLPVDLRIEVLEQKTVGDTNWGRIGEMLLNNGTKVTGGWINLSYVKLDSAEPENPVEDPTTPTTGSNDSTVSGTGKKGTITASELNIRKSTSTSSDKVGKYIKGDTVEILEQKTVDGTTWGRTNKGWISMKYVKLDGQTTTTTPDDDKDDDKTTSSEVVTDGKTKVLGYGVVDLGSLNVRSGPGTKYDKVGTVSEGSRYAYYQKSGNWVRIKSGWVSVSYFYLEGTSASDGGTGTVTATELNIRKGPGSSYDSAGVLKQGETVKILAQANGWGYTSKGWVSMKHVKLESTGTTYSTGKGTVTTDLNIRKEATKDSDKVGMYDEGDAVEILEVKDDWGRTSKGWISMKYVKMTTTSSDKTEDNVGKNTTFKTGDAVVEVNSTLTIRKSASTSAEKVGAYENGDKVKITEVSGEWGKTSKGWINLRYVKFS